MDSTTGRKAHTTLAGRVRNGLTKLRQSRANAERVDELRAEFQRLDLAPEILLTRIR